MGHLSEKVNDTMIDKKGAEISRYQEDLTKYFGINKNVENNLIFLQPAFVFISTTITLEVKRIYCLFKKHSVPLNINCLQLHFTFAGFVKRKEYFQ